jgi:fucose 4-O-acetylase-like acetyltransferase
VLGDLLRCNTPYAKIKALTIVPRLLQGTSRVWFYGIASALIISFLALVPRGKTVFTKLGKETLSVYVLHIFLYLANRQFKWYLLFASPWGIAAMGLIALAITVLFSVKPFTLPFHGLQKIKVKLRSPDEAA